MGIEQRGVVGSADGAVAEQGFVPLAPGVDIGLVEGLGDRVLVRVLQWPPADLLHELLSYFRVELRATTADDLPAGRLH